MPVFCPVPLPGFLLLSPSIFCLFNKTKAGRPPGCPCLALPLWVLLCFVGGARGTGQRRGWDRGPAGLSRFPSEGATRETVPKRPGERCTPQVRFSYFPAIRGLFAFLSVNCL